ncbi:ribosomal protein S18-alanine N-acetyltransferase [Aliidiomarina quisquiliarum]|uniref:ribosomal protein S18-alanine N-acetyltransferase n=1 Tax=Aliidiomarina quisquiliarum TaxID=2938947 RepID=UPI00208E8159|nr:ribosomal protein S18-alanine N-acetyltransferase [Aliidiomarina quisquiliarum]MCO4322060.1 ribosomal protein S18-alanine N-acetyltransferase [Aliidiomarina quisquiliarum]
MIIAPIYQYIPALYAIESVAHLVPWSERTLQGCFGSNYRVIGLYNENELIGFYIVQDIAGEQTLMNIAVHPNFQGQGFGSVLLNDLLMRASTWQQSQLALAIPVYLDVRESNHSAIRLYERYGFKVLGKRLNYYPLPNSTERETGLVYGRLADLN